MWNPIWGQKVSWQNEQPGYVRMRVPQDAKVVLQTRVRGKDARRASRCGSCSTVVIPADESYDA